MNTEFVWLQRELPWLGSGFIHAVAESFADRLSADLEGLGFTVVTLRCGAGCDLLVELGPTLRFPSWYGANWDAVHDCFRDLEMPHPFALVWRDAEGFAVNNAKLFGEACAILTAEFNSLSTRGIQAVLVITGNGPAFGGPHEARDGGR